MATIHLGIGLIINILNLLNKKSPFRAGKPLAEERIFASHPRFFVFTITPSSGGITVSTGLFAEAFSADQSPPGCWILIHSHFKKLLMKRLYRLGGGENSSVGVNLSYSLSHWDKTFLPGGQIQISFFQEPNPKCSSVRSWGWIFPTPVSVVGLRGWLLLEPTPLA